MGLPRSEKNKIHRRCHTQDTRYAHGAGSTQDTRYAHGAGPTQDTRYAHGAGPAGESRRPSFNSWVLAKKLPKQQT